MQSGIPFYIAKLIAEKSWMIENGFLENSSTYCYLTEGRDYALLIDSILGMGNLKAFCETLTAKPIILVNTHAHSDHFGGNFFFDSCYMHYRDIGSFQDSVSNVKKQQVADMARELAREEYRDQIKPDDNFRDWDPMKVYPLHDGDMFDLGDRRIEVIEAGGHTEGSVVLLDPLTRIAYSGDACNGNTLLEFANSLPIISYLRSLLRLKENQGRFDQLYGGHEVFDASLIDEAIETVSRVIAGTDAHDERIGLMGYPVFYAAEKVKGGYERVDGKHFNMSYVPEKVRGTEETKQVVVLRRKENP